MNPKSPLARPLKVALVDGEVVFLGEGAVNFSMTLEAAEQTARNLSDVMQAAMQAGGPPAPVILVVEDEAMIRAHVAMSLSDAGYSVIEASDAQEALLELERGAQIDLLFTDVQMPGSVDGLKLAQWVSVRWPRVTLLVSSGSFEPAKDAIPSGGRFLGKPYDFHELLRHVRELTAAAA